MKHEVFREAVNISLNCLHHCAMLYIITNLRADLVANTSPAWIDLGGNKFRSAVDGDGRFLQILMTRVDARRLQMDVIDQNNTTITQRRVTISSTWNRVTIFSGQYHVCINVVKSETRLSS